MAVGCKVVATTDLSVGVNDEVLQKEVNRATSFFEHKLSDSGRRAECEKKNVRFLRYGSCSQLCALLFWI